MGVMFQPECPCGHPFTTVLEGVGEEGVIYRPAICSGCEDVLSVPVGDARSKPVRDLQARGTCGACGGRLQFLFPERCKWAQVGSWDNGAARESTVERYPCPKCHQQEMVLVVYGIWD